jgi:excisionase family DNA binding protein
MQAIRVDLSQPLLNADDVAALLSVPRSSVYEYARRQRDPIPSVAIGRHRRFIREAIEAWLASHRAGSTSRGSADRKLTEVASSNPKPNGGQSRGRRRRRR